MRWLIRQLLKAYRLAVSPWLGSHCRFHPSCSAYALGAFEQFPLGRALRLTAARLLRCHPWHPGGYDPLPDDGATRGTPRDAPPSTSDPAH